MNKIVVILGLVALLIGAGLLFMLQRPPADGVLAGTDAAGQPAATANQSVAIGVDQIPPQFQASWAPDRLNCTTRGETARVEISSDGIKFYESAGQLRQVTPLNGGRECAVLLDMTGEGTTWSRTIHVRRVGHELAFRDAESVEERLFIRC